MNHKLNDLLRFCGVCAAVLLLSGLPAMAAPPGDLKPVNAVAAVVNGEIITNEEVRSSAKLALDTLKEQYSGAELEARARAVLRDRLQQLIEKKLLLHEAKRAIKKEEIRKEAVEKDLDRVLKDLIDQAGSMLQLKKMLASKGETLEQARERRREDLLIEEVLRRNLLPYVVVSPREIRQYYKDHIAEFSQKKQVKFRQILIRFSEYETKEQAREVAESLLQKLKAGATFENLAKEYSRDPYAKDGGLWANGALISRGTVLKEIDEAIFKLPVGEASGLVESPQGCHILRVEEIKPERVVPFEEVQEDIRRLLTEERWNKRYNAYLAELKAKAYVEMK